ARVRYEVGGRLVEVRGDRFHRRHALCDEREIGLEESDSAVERLAQPVIERLRETYPVPSFGHFRAAGERVAGAVDLLGKLVRRRPAGRACEKASHDGNVRGGLARIDLAQRLISALSRRAARGWFGLVDRAG